MPATACRIRRTTDQSVLDNTDTTISFDTEDFDQGNMADLVAQPTRITIATAGIYMVGGNYAFSGNLTGDRVGKLLLNGTTIIAHADTRALSIAANLVKLHIVTIYKFAAGDYIELVLAQSSTVTLQASAQANYANVLWAILLEDG